MCWVELATVTDAATLPSAEKIEALIQNAGYGPGEYLVKSVSPNEISRYLSTANVAISFIKACYSKLSSSPTKIAEYLACGVPIITNRGVGDVAEMIESNSVGVVIDLKGSAYLDSLAFLAEPNNLRNLCRKVAITEFEMASVGGVRYRQIYSQLREEM